jgi:NAD(P)-dependent dehydrogenase (short-subunit alcohol dehydrogenase family)
MPRTLLITGCSSGIGAALALEFHARGHRVYATARRPEALIPLAEKGIAILPLDVNDEASIDAAFARVESEAGRLDMLVNNAGFSQVGAVLDLTRDDLRRQYETNVIAPLAVTRSAMPLLRAAVGARGHAEVVNVGSIVGLFTTPFQPGGVRSSFGNHAEEALRLPENSLYKPIEAGIRARAQAGQQDATPAAQFVIPVVDKLLLDKPPAIIRGGKGSRQFPLMKKLLSLKAFDAGLSKRFGLDKFRP